jgi:ATP-dependent Clp protease ATP-binding subunit ClpA
MLTEKLTSSDLEFYLKTHLVGQDEAIEQFAAKLTEESLTRPLHQPLRLCLQGTPATGKSESTILLAQFLGVPYINIDAASIPDFYVASAQLLGSGRGIVGSHKAGRLEEAAKHHTAVVIEISDMDHANNNVRAALADLFLQVLSSGQAQAASGNMFSCANLILIFTINLPKGKDESLRKPGIGFNNFPTQKDIRSGVAKEVKSLFSSAFLSRIGNPVLYTTLQGDSLKLIAERSMKNALQSAAERLNKSVKEILVENCATESIVNALENLDSFGARLINDVARNHISQAFVRFIKKHPRKIHAKLIVTTNETGRIEILQEKKEESC